MPKTILLLCFVIASLECLAQGNRYDVVIDEIMADPTPQVGLPNNEWIELRNISNTAINLQGWKISDASGISGAMPSFVLQPDSFVIVCTSSAVAVMSSFGRTISVTNFPSLDNAGDRLYLQSAQAKIIHAVEYSDTWYQNTIKANGGWTLEMIDTKNPCGGMSNWKASIDPSGGTPGRKNSIDGNNLDQTPPQLLRTYSIDSVTVVAVFDEPLDSTSASTIGNYSIVNVSISSAIAQTPLFNTVILKLSTAIQKRIVYNLTVNNVQDCRGNSIGVYNKAKVGLAEEASSMDVVINEILFDPRPNAYDYIELYNRSNKIIDAAKIIIANRSSSGNIGTFQNLSASPLYIFPGDYIVATEDAVSLSKEYFVPNPSQVLTLSLPSYPDDKGDVVITNSQGNIVDEVAYSADWQFKLINNPEGVALERIDPDGLSQDASNWHSAASTAGYGTPTAKNSQYKQFQSGNATIEITPKVFSPDNDGIDDIAVISYTVDQPGYVANIIIFDANGRSVKYLVKNQLLANKGSWNWDGLDDKNQKLPIGTYIVFAEIFNLQGKKQQFKNSLVLARRFK